MALGTFGHQNSPMRDSCKTGSVFGREVVGDRLLYLTVRINGIISISFLCDYRRLGVTFS